MMNSPPNYWQNDDDFNNDPRFSNDSQNNRTDRERVRDELNQVQEKINALNTSSFTAEADVDSEFTPAPTEKKNRASTSKTRAGRKTTKKSSGAVAKPPPVIRQRVPIPFPARISQYSAQFPKPEPVFPTSFISNLHKSLQDRLLTEIISPTPRSTSTPNTNHVTFDLPASRLVKDTSVSASASASTSTPRRKELHEPKGKPPKIPEKKGALKKNLTRSKSVDPGSRSADISKRKTKVPKTATTNAESSRKSSTTAGPSSCKVKKSKKKVAASGSSSSLNGKRKHKSLRRKRSGSKVNNADALSLSVGLAETHIPLSQNPNLSYTGSSDTESPSVSNHEKLNFAAKCPKFSFNPDTPLPGTKAWDQYWKNYHKALAKFDGEMLEYSKGLEGYSDIIQEYRREAKRITDEERAFKIGLDHLGTLGIATGGYPDVQPPPMRRVPIQEEPLSFNGYVISSRKVEGIISNQLGKEGGLLVEVNVGTADQDSLEVERDHHFFTLFFGRKRHFLHICVPPGKSPENVVMHHPIGGMVTIEAP